MKPTISIIIPAFNEEKCILPTVESVLFAIDDRFSDYEIIIFNDGSTDNTGEIARKISEENHRVRVVQNKKNIGFGYNYKKGVELSKYDYISLVYGDNEILRESIVDMYNSIGKADIIIPFTVNYRDRPFIRRCLTYISTKTLNFLFSLNLRYYNGPVIYKKDDIKHTRLSTNSFAFQVEALVKLIKSGRSLAQIETYFVKRAHGKSKVFHLKNIIGVLRTVVVLFFNIRLLEKRRETNLFTSKL